MKQDTITKSQLQTISDDYHVPTTILLSRSKQARTNVDSLPTELDPLFNKAIDLTVKVEYLKAVIQYQKDIILKKS